MTTDAEPPGAPHAQTAWPPFSLPGGRATALPAGQSRGGRAFLAGLTVTKSV